MTQRTAIIIGAGPAGLTAALELLRRGGRMSDGSPAIRPIVIEADDSIGGISRTVQYKGNRMDIGGHRFFSKSDRVMQWWLDLMPIADEGAGHAVISYQNRHRSLETLHAHTQPDADPDLVMLVRSRRSRIYFLRRFFDYPITLTADTLGKLGLLRTARVGTSYIVSRLHQRRPEKSLEDFLINRFGRQLYQTFFQSYTEKVWGVRCSEISAEWGAQRIKGLSLTTAVGHFLRRTFSTRPRGADLAQKHTETSLIEQFLYPKHGPGQLWEHVADLVRQQGGEVLTGWRVDRIETDGAQRIVAVEAQNKSAERRRVEADYCFSTMPVTELIRAIKDANPAQPVPANVQEVADGLMYRDFITVGLLVDRLLVTEPDGSPLKDTWIYVQEPDVLLGRLQIFNNWSPYMVADPSKVWIGLEYFCYQTDPLWRMSDEEVQRFAVAELEKIDIIRATDVRDGHVVRVPKTYPAYFGTYERFEEIREWLDPFENLFLVGRNGMHKYNNQDHSMLTAMTAVDNILAGITDKSSLWEINTEQDYHEEKTHEEKTRQQEQHPETTHEEAKHSAPTV
jgi:protoporphyrinogen oxidase